jgi:hypothetical protein
VGGGPAARPAPHRTGPECGPSRRAKVGAREGGERSYRSTGASCILSAVARAAPGEGQTAPATRAPAGAARARRWCWVGSDAATRPPRPATCAHLGRHALHAALNRGLPHGWARGTASGGRGLIQRCCAGGSSAPARLQPLPAWARWPGRARALRCRRPPGLCRGGLPTLSFSYLLLRKEERVESLKIVCVLGGTMAKLGRSGVDRRPPTVQAGRRPDTQPLSFPHSLAGPHWRCHCTADSPQHAGPLIALRTPSHAVQPHVTSILRPNSAGAASAGPPRARAREGGAQARRARVP